jgi:hypothetical protein
LTVFQLFAQFRGKSYAHTTRSLKPALVLTEKQIRALCERDERGDHKPLTQKDLLKLSDIEHDETRAIAVELVSAGWSVITAIKEACARTNVTQNAKKRRGESLTDQQWLEASCARVRSRIQDSSRFDNDAVLWRRTVDSRRLDIAASRQEVEAAYSRSTSPFAGLFRSLLFIAHPRDWHVCEMCRGLNEDDPYCRECGGNGYRLKVLWPTPEVID